MIMGRCWGTVGEGHSRFSRSRTHTLAGQFRAQVAHLSVNKPAQAPRQLKGKPLGASIAAGEVPTLAQLRLQPVTRIPGTSHVRGGAHAPGWLPQGVTIRILYCHVVPTRGPRIPHLTLLTVWRFAPSRI